MSIFVHPRSGLELEPKFGSASMTAIELATGKPLRATLDATQNPATQMATFVTVFWSLFARYGEHAPTLGDAHEMIDANPQMALDATGVALAAYAERSRRPGAK